MQSLSTYPNRQRLTHSQARAILQRQLLKEQRDEMTPEQRQRFDNTVMIGGRLLQLAPTKPTAWQCRQALKAAIDTGDAGKIRAAAAQIRADGMTIEVADGREFIAKYGDEEALRRRRDTRIFLNVLIREAGACHSETLTFVFEPAVYQENLDGLRDLLGA